MRNRLIELLGKADEATEILTGDFPSYEEELQAFYSSIADYLLDNGVIVLPCAVGDTVWYTDCEDDEKGVLPCAVHNESFACIVKDLWGIKFFATKEEAEAKLEELKGE